MNNKGEINPSVLLELFQELGTSNKVIQLDFVRDDGRQIQLIYKNGSLIYVPKESHRGLEIFLIGEGVLTLEQVEELIKYKKESGQPLEQLIIQADILTEEQLKKVWETIAKDFVLDLFTCESGEYQAIELPSYESDNLGIFPLEKLGSCESEITQMIENVATLGGLKSIYKIANNSSFLNIENIAEESRKHIQSAINGKNSVLDVINWSFFTVSKTLKILNDLKVKNSISLVTAEIPRPIVDVVIEKEKTQDNKVKEELSTDTPLPTTGNFSGSLSVLSLVEVLKPLNNAKRTGVLTLDIKNGPATLNMVNGEIVGVVYGDIKNKDAFYKIITIRKGEFYFESSQNNFSKDMDIPTMSLLMEALKLTGEGANSSTDDTLSKSFEEQPMSSRVLKRKESKASLFIKVVIFFGIVVYFAVYFIVLKPANEKEEAFVKQKAVAIKFINTNEYSLALESWNKFLIDYKVEHPDWEVDIIQEKDLITGKLKENIKAIQKDIEKYIKINDYAKSLDNLKKLETLISGLGNDLQKVYSKEKEQIVKQREIVLNQQKELDYNNWKSNLEMNMSKIKNQVSDFEHEEALKEIKLIEQNLDKVKDKSYYDTIVEYKKAIEDRESIIKVSQALIEDKNASFPNKIEAYEKIIFNAGLKQARGKEANKQLIIAKEKMNSFESKLKGILQSHNKDSIASRVQLIEQLQKEVTSKEEAQFLEKEKEKILEINVETVKLQKSFNDLIAKKDFKGAFLVGRKIIDQNGDNEVLIATKLPFAIENQPDLTLKINGNAVALPYRGEITYDQVTKIQAEKKGCKTISLNVDKNLKSYVVELNFKKMEMWSIEFKGDLEVSPEICLSGKGLVLANQTDLEMILLETGVKVWRRQINNPTKPFKKPNGNKVIIGDDEFWKLDSEICVFENYISICSKNSELFVLSAEDGNNIVKQEMSFYSKSAPMIVRSNLLGNKAFVYSGTSDGNLICVAIDDQSIRLQEKLGDANNGILGVYPLNEHFFVAILEQNVQCFSLSTSKLKWSKSLNNKVKNVFVLGNKIFARQQDGLMEITDSPDTWKLISFPTRDLKEIVHNSKGLLLLGDGKIYFLDDSSNRFSPIGIPAAEKKVLFSNGKYYEQNEKFIKCYDGNTQKVLWETDNTSGPIKKMRIAGNYLLYNDDALLHAIMLEN